MDILMANNTPVATGSVTFRVIVRAASGRRAQLQQETCAFNDATSKSSEKAVERVLGSVITKAC
jgi:hypothetical protein